MEKRERIIGGIMGVVVGDALGLPVQFMSRDEVRRNPVTEMRGRGTFDLPPGSWSDDSSLTLCLAKSLADKGEFDMADVARSFVAWLGEGYMTPYGYAYDIGGTTAKAVSNMRQWIKSGANGPPDTPFGPNGERDNGNGALMRILPGILFYDQYFGVDPEQDAMVGQVAVDIAAMTHGHQISILACGIYGAIVTNLMDGKDPARACKMGQIEWGLPEQFNRILAGNVQDIPESEIRSTGYVVDSLEAAIWCFTRQDNYRDTVLAAVNLGGDTDTIAAIAGGLAGVAYGIGDIPTAWIAQLAKGEMVMQIARDFADACEAPHSGLY